MHGLFQKTLTLSLLLLLFLPFVIGHTATLFSVATTSPQVAPLCPRDTGLFVDSLVNSGTTPQSVTVSVQGNAASWSTTVPLGFVLEPGESRAVYTYVTPQQNTPPAAYALDVLFTAPDGDLLTSMHHSLTVKNCFQSQFSVAQAAQSVCPGEVSSYDFVVSNQGTYQEQFLLKPEGQLGSAVSLSDALVDLAPGQSKKVYAYLTTPADAGDYGFSVVSTGSSGRSVNSIPFAVAVRPCYDFRAVTLQDSTLNLCDAGTLDSFFSVSNLGTVTNLYRFTFDGPSWVTLSKNSVTLLPGASEQVVLTLHPPYGIQGAFSGTVTVTPERGALKASLPLVFNVQKCHSVSVTLPQPEGTLCSNGQARVFSFSIKNTGTFLKTYRTGVIMPYWVKTTVPATLTLAPGQEQSFSFTATPAENVVPDVYPIGLMVNASDASGKTASSSAVLRLTTIGFTQCYQPVLEASQENVKVSRDATDTIALTVRNVGIEAAAYEVFVGGTATSFVHVAPALLNIQPGKTDTTYLYLAPGQQTPVDAYDLVVGVKLKESGPLAQKTLSVKITAAPDELQTGFVVAPTVSQNRWQRFRAWFKRLFVPSHPVVQNATDDLNETDVLVDQIHNETADLVATFNVSSQEANSDVDVATALHGQNLSEPLVTEAKPVSVGDLLYRLRYYILGFLAVVLVILLFFRLGLSSPPQHSKALKDVPAPEDEVKPLEKKESVHVVKEDVAPKKRVVSIKPVKEVKKKEDILSDDVVESIKEDTGER